MHGNLTGMPRHLLLAALTALAPLMAHAGEAVVVSDAWFRMLLPQRPAAGYFELVNEGDQPVDLVGVRTYACGLAMLHKTMSQNGQDSMEMVSKLTVEPQSTLSFAPGGYHIMCIMPQSRMVVGATVPVELIFADGSSVTVEFEVRGPSGN